MPLEELQWELWNFTLRAEDGAKGADLFPILPALCNTNQKTVTFSSTELPTAPLQVLLTLKQTTHKYLTKMMKIGNVGRLFKKK